MKRLLYLLFGLPALLTAQESADSIVYFKVSLSATRSYEHSMRYDMSSNCERSKGLETHHFILNLAADADRWLCHVLPDGTLLFQGSGLSELDSARCSPMRMNGQATYTYIERDVQTRTCVGADSCENITQGEASGKLDLLTDVRLTDWALRYNEDSGHGAFWYRAAHDASLMDARGETSNSGCDAPFQKFDMTDVVRSEFFSLLTTQSTFDLETHPTEENLKQSEANGFGRRCTITPLPGKRGYELLFSFDFEGDYPGEIPEMINHKRVHTALKMTLLR